MAAPVLRLARHPRGGGTPRALTAAAALTAASAPVEDPASIFKTKLGRRADWQDEAWQLYNAVGELGFYVRWRSRSCSRVRLVASEIDDEGNPTGGIAEDNAEGRRVADVVRAIAGGPLGQAELIERSVQLLSVPGEYWCVLLVTDEGERWLAVSREEIKPSAKVRDGVVITLPEGKDHEYDRANGDGMFRVWNPHARRASDADSPVRSNLDPLREIAQTTKKIRNADQSRLNNNGLLLVPSEASLPAAQAPVSAGKPAGSTPPPSPLERRIAGQLQEMIVRAAEVAAEPDGEKKAASLVPIVIAAPGEHLKNVHHLDFSKDVTETAIKTRDNAIKRLAMGLDMTPEQLTGLGDSNHWSRWQAADEDVNMHVKPVMKTICQALYQNVVANVLVKLGIDPRKYTLWFDASDLTADPDKSDDASEANERMALRNDEYLRAHGLPEDGGYDLTSIEGYEQLAQDWVKRDPNLIPVLLPFLKPLHGMEFPAPTQQQLPPANEPDEPDEPTGAQRQQEPDTEDDQQQAAASTDGLAMAMELMYTRAMELAGNRRVNTSDRALYARLRNVPKHEYHRYLPPAHDGEVPRLIKGWDAGLDELATRYGFDADEVRALVSRRARKALTADVVDGQVM